MYECGTEKRVSGISFSYKKFFNDDPKSRDKSISADYLQWRQIKMRNRQTRQEQTKIIIGLFGATFKEASELNTHFPQ
jgi:macrodomain Ter protein organizer (MatP/YcbG family)